MKKSLYLACFLAVVSAVAGGLLAAVNNLTQDRINANALAEVMGSLETMFPGTDYEEITDYTDETGLVTGVYEAAGQGYLFQVASNGFNGPIQFVIGIDNNSTIVGYDVISNTETSGVGTRVAEDAFKNTVIGKTTGDTIDTLTDATISSTAVINGIDAAKAVYADLSGNTAPAPSATAQPEESDSATVIDQTTDGTQTTVTVQAQGFQGANTYEVVLDTENQSVISVTMTQFNDTPGIGDQVDEEYLAGFAGMTSLDQVSGADVVSGATYTSNSAIEAVKVAWNAARVMGILETMFPGTDYEKITDYTDETGLVTGVYEAVGQGYLFQVVSNGFNGPIQFVIGIDNNSTIVGYDVISNTETSGVGTRVAEDAFKNTVIGKTTGDTIDTLTDATISSTAVINGIDAAKAVYADLSGNTVPAPSATAQSDSETSNGNVELTSTNGTEETYTVRTQGFQGENEFEVVIDTASGEVVSVTMTQFNDTPGIGDQVNEEYLAGFVGMTSLDQISGADVVSSATYTSNSAIEAVSAAFAASQE